MDVSGMRLLCFAWRHSLRRRGRGLGGGRLYRLEIMGDDKLMEAHGQEKPHSLVPHPVPHERHFQ